MSPTNVVGHRFEVLIAAKAIIIASIATQNAKHVSHTVDTCHAATRNIIRASIFLLGSPEFSSGLSVNTFPILAVAMATGPLYRRIVDDVVRVSELVEARAWSVIRPVCDRLHPRNPTALTISAPLLTQLGRALIRGTVTMSVGLIMKLLRPLSRALTISQATSMGMRLGCKKGIWWSSIVSPIMVRTFVGQQIDVRTLGAL